ncbi:MAG: hypothetical protein AB7V19_00230, partial [Candidatus Bipolaricaulia bacterium]
MLRRLCALLLVGFCMLVGVAPCEAVPDLADGLSALFVLSDSYAANVGVWSAGLDRLGYEVTFAGVGETIPAFDYAGAAIRVDRTLAEVGD